jgi:hypothetical protein
MPPTDLSVIISAVIVRVDAVKVFVMRSIPLNADVATAAAAEGDPAQTKAAAWCVSTNCARQCLPLNAGLASAASYLRRQRINGEQTIEQ